MKKTAVLFFCIAIVMMSVSCETARNRSGIGTRSSGDNETHRLMKKEEPRLVIQDWHVHGADVVFSPDSETWISYFIANPYLGGVSMIKIWNRKGKLVNSLSVSEGRLLRPFISGDSSMIVARVQPYREPYRAEEKTSVYLWSRDGTEKKILSWPAGNAEGFIIRPDSSAVVSYHDDGTIAIWGRDGSLIRTFSGLGGIRDLVISHDGATMASSGVDGMVRFLTRKGDIAGVIRVSDGSGYDGELAFSPDDEILAATSTVLKGKDRSSSIHLLSRDGKIIKELHGQKDISFIRGRKLLLTRASEGTSMSIWSYDGMEMLTTGPDEELVIGNAGDLIARYKKEGNFLTFLIKKTK